MDWRSSSDSRPHSRRWQRTLAALCLGALCSLGLAFTSGCGKNAVRASEKEFLADRVMLFDADGQEANADQHVLTNREGSSGGSGSGGGGCGCN